MRRINSPVGPTVPTEIQGKSVHHFGSIGIWPTNNLWGGWERKGGSSAPRSASSRVVGGPSRRKRRSPSQRIRVESACACRRARAVALYSGCRRARHLFPPPFPLFPLKSKTGLSVFSEVGGYGRKVYGKGGDAGRVEPGSKV